MLMLVRAQWKRVKAGGTFPLEKNAGEAAGQNGDLLSKCSQCVSLPPFFFVISERDGEVVVDRRGLCGG
jgi:hypothetical protein